MNDFDVLLEKNEGFYIENGVVVEKDVNGKFVVFDVELWLFKGGVIGVIVGGLFGLFVGLFGVVIGMVVGVVVGIFV